MNERLEKEWKSYCAKQGSGTMISVNVKDVAQHFYNLALEDVKKEIERRMKQWHCCDFMAEMEDGVDGQSGLLDFLNQLSK